MLNKKILEKKVNAAMKKAYIKSFKGGVLDNDMMKSIRAAAKCFADAAAPALADAIEEYVKSGDIILPNAGTQTFTVKKARSNMRVVKINTANDVLKIIYGEGIQMKIKTSAEDLIDGDEKNVLALVFSILLKFMKIGDDEDGRRLDHRHLPLERRADVPAVLMGRMEYD